MRISIAVLASALVVTYAAGAAAQTRSATVLLRSGERVSGAFEDIQNNQLYLRVSQDDERRIPRDQVAIIDFVGGTRGLPETELSEARSGGDLLLLQNGSALKGSLVDVRREGEGGERTLADARVHLIFRGSDGRTQEIPVDQAARVYLGPLPDLSAVEGAMASSGTPDTGASTSAGGNFTQEGGRVPATQQWTPTGVFVRAGQLVSFNPTGQIRVGPNEIASPAGVTTQRIDPMAPLPQALAGALIGRVGSSTFGIGDQTAPLRMPATGELFLGINESTAALGDNEGAFTVLIVPRAATRVR